jgi:glycosyltransferase involved in cell wall biosynthesis
MKPQISIVMPTYNRANSFLKNAVQSVLTQTYKNFELIIVDDASIDNTFKLINSFNDKRIVYYKTKHNHGEYWATNYGISLSKGKYITWLHSDDILPLNSLQIRVKELEINQQLDFVHGDIIIIDEKGNEIKKKESTDLNTDEVFKTFINNLIAGKMISTLVHHTTIMMKRNFFYKVGPFDCSLPFAGDIDWLVRALRIGKYKRIPEILYLYRIHNQTRRILDIKSGINKEAIHKQIASRYI